MHINLMCLNLPDVFVGDGLVENFGDFARHLGTVNLHEKVFHDFRFHRGDVFFALRWHWHPFSSRPPRFCALM